MPFPIWPSGVHLLSTNMRGALEHENLSTHRRLVALMALVTGLLVVTLVAM